MMILYNVFVLNIIGLILSQLGITEQMEHCKRKLSSSKAAFIEVPGVAETQDNIFLQQVVAQLVSKLFGKNHREICYSFSYCFFCSCSATIRVYRKPNQAKTTGLLS